MKTPKNTPSLLLVEDEENLAIGLEFNLKQEGYAVEWVDDGKKAIDVLEKNEYDLIILDIMLPYFDGFEIAKKVREKDIRVPILMLTARGGDADRIAGLENGADDYLTKPFHLQELLLRVAGMLKRKSWYKNDTDVNDEYYFGKNYINFKNLTAEAKNKKSELTLHEAMLMKYLIQHKGNIVSRRELLEKVWDINSEIETRTVDNFIMKLRKYFEPDPSNPKYIKSVRGAGYIFDDQC
jgi:DNA-binding response OmpR family regulator